MPTDYHWFIHLRRDAARQWYNSVEQTKYIYRVGLLILCKTISSRRQNGKDLHLSLLWIMFCCCAMLCMPSICLPVRPFVCLPVCDIQVCFSCRLEYSKKIPWLISLRFLIGLTSTSAIWSKGNTPKFEWNMGVVMSRKPAIYPKRCKIGGGYYDGLIGSSIHAFWFVLKWKTAKSMPTTDPYT